MPYSGNPASSSRDEVRFLVGDTDNGQLELSDAEIDFLLVQAGGAARHAAPLAADALASKFAKQVTYSTGRVSRQLGDKAKQMRELAAALRREAARYVVPISTGQDPAADLEDAQNQALKQPQFILEQFDNAEAVRPRDVPLSEDDLL